MSSMLRRIRGLLDRLRIDGRLPPPVRSVYQRAATARRDHAIAIRMAALRPVLGTEGDHVARLASRRVATAGPLTSSIDELALDTCDATIGLLTGSGLQPFVVNRDADRVVIGLQLAERRRALRALSAVEGPGWFLRWEDRGAEGLTALRVADGNRRARRARSWTVFHSHQIGDRATGHEAGVVVTFWTPGTSGQLELVGTRGHERFDARSEPTIEVVGGREFPGRTAFPIGRSLERFVGDVDVVFTWVDGSDPAWLEQFRSAALAQGRPIDEESLDPARFRSRDELRYALRSVWMNCGWVRRIWVVTAGQRPQWLVEHPGVTVVDHRDILPGDGLPTFNSHAIEASLHRIAGLAEHFVYFNDDVMATRPLRPETFFHSNGIPKVFQGGARVPAVEDENTQAVDRAAIRGRELLEARFGRVVECKPYHCPFPLLRSVMSEVEDEFPEAVGATRRSRFRSSSDLSVAASFAQHYALATGRATLGEIATEYVHVESDRLRWHLDAVRFGRDVDTCCINETRDGASDRDRREAMIRAFFEDMWPVPAPWERTRGQGDE